MYSARCPRPRRRQRNQNVSLKGHILLALAAVALASSAPAGAEEPVDHTPPHLVELPRERDMVFLRGVETIVAEGIAMSGFINGTLAANVAAAEAGDANAQAALGMRFYEGIGGTRKDLAKGAHWHRLAADQGHAIGESSMGRACLEGGGVPRDAARGTRYYTRAAAKLQPGALGSLGNAWAARGDADEAVRWFARVAAQGIPVGLRELRRFANDGVSSAIAALRKFEPTYAPPRKAARLAAAEELPEEL